MARMVDTVRTWRTTQVVDGTLVKVLAWYDNEWGFTHQMVREAQSTLGATRRAPDRGPSTDNAGVTRPGRMTITHGWVAAAKRGAER